MHFKLIDALRKLGELAKAFFEVGYAYPSR